MKPQNCKRIFSAQCDTCIPCGTFNNNLTDVNTELTVYYWCNKIACELLLQETESI